MNFIIIIFVSAFAGLAVAFFILGIAFDEKSLKTYLRLNEDHELEKEEATYFKFSVISSFLFSKIVKIFNLVSDKTAQKKLDLLMRAGIQEQDIYRFYSAKILMTLLTPLVLTAFLMVMGIIAPALQKYWQLTFFGGFPLGFFIIELWLLGIINKRVKQIIREFPFMLDMTSLSVKAGMEFTAALRRFQQTNSPSALNTEIKQILYEISVGASRQEALKNLKKRIRHNDIISFSITLIQAIRLGASIGDTLSMLADKMRDERLNRAERAGTAAAQKMLIPLMICILPAVMIIIVGVAYFSFKQNQAML